MIWSVRYDCEQNDRQPLIQGPVPEQITSVLEAAREQAAADGDEDVDFMFDVTANLGRALVGFRYDMTPEVDDALPFQVLARAGGVGSA